MRLLIVNHNSAWPKLGSDSAYNLSFEFAKYLDKYYPEWYVYLVVPELEKVTLRGDEGELIDKGKLFFLNVPKISEKPGSTMWGGWDVGLMFEVLNREKVFVDSVLTNYIFGYPLLLIMLAKMGFGGVCPVMRPDWYHFFTSIKEYRDLVRRFLVSLAYDFPVVAHSKWCVEGGLGISLESDEANTILKWGIMYPPYDDEKIVKRDGPTDNDVPHIIFNHRNRPYTGYVELLKAVKKIAERKIKVKINTTYSHSGGATGLRTFGAGGIDGLYAKYSDILSKVYYKKDEYYKSLPKYDAVIAWNQGTGGYWSISLLEAVASGCYPLTHGKFFYKEILGENIPEYSIKADGIVEAVQFYVDNWEYCDKLARHYARMVREKWSWDTQVHNWLNIVKKGMYDADVRPGTKWHRILSNVDVVDFDTIISEFIGTKRPKTIGVGEKYQSMAQFSVYLRKMGFVDVGGRIPKFVRKGGSREWMIA